MLGRVDAVVVSDYDKGTLTDKVLKAVLPSCRVRTPGVRILRVVLDLTQEEFAKRFGLSLATVRDWEQARSEPDQASKTLLTLIQRIPDEVEQALAEES